MLAVETWPPRRQLVLPKLWTPMAVDGFQGCIFFKYYVKYMLKKENQDPRKILKMNIFCRYAEDTLSGFQEFFLQPVIKDRSNILREEKVIMSDISLYSLCI